VGVNPETLVVEAADGLTRASRQYLACEPPSRRGLPGAWAHVESSWEATERERPAGNREVVAGAWRRGKTGAAGRQWSAGVGPSHSSDEACEGSASGRAGGAKGRAGQGSRRRER
jgi:hypothetical protein